MAETPKLAAILAADVVGYSRPAGSDEDRTLARLLVFRRKRNAKAEHAGRSGASACSYATPAKRDTRTPSGWRTPLTLPLPADAVSFWRNEEAANAGDLGLGYVRGRRLLGRRINIPCVRFNQPG